MTCLETAGEDLVWTQAYEATSPAPLALWEAAALESGSAGGRLSLLVPYDDAAGLLYAYGAGVEGGLRRRWTQKIFFIM